MQENADQNNSEYGHFLHSVIFPCFRRFCVSVSTNIVFGLIDEIIDYIFSPFLSAFLYLLLCVRTSLPEVYSEPCQTSKMEMFLQK